MIFTIKKTKQKDLHIMLDVDYYRAYPLHPPDHSLVLVSFPGSQKGSIDSPIKWTFDLTATLILSRICSLYSNTEVEPQYP